MIMGLNILDFILIALVLFTAVGGYRKGFIKTLLNLAGLLIAVFVAKVFHAEGAVWLKQNFDFFGSLDSRLLEKLTAQFSSDQSPAALINPDSVANTLHLPDIILSGQPVNGMMYDTLFGELSEKIANALTQGVAFSLIFLGIMLLLFIVGFVTSALAELPILKQVNRLGGLFLGIVLGVLNTFILITVMTLIIPFMKSTWILSSINDSLLAIEIYNHNILLYLLYYFMKT